MFEFIGRMVRRFWLLFLLGWVGLVVVLNLSAPRFKDVAADGGRFLLPGPLGFALAVGLLLDTFLVRPIIVPSIVLLAQRISRRNRPG